MIREAVRDDDGGADRARLPGRVPLEPYLALADVVAPATDRRRAAAARARPSEPDLVAISVDEADARVAARQLERG